MADYLFVARKVNRAKWEPPDNWGDRSAPADAVSSCMKTSKNTLSFWQFMDPGTDLKEVALAHAASMEHLALVDLIWIPIADLKDLQIDTAATLGDTPVQDLKDRHIDLTQMDCRSQAELASRLFERGVRENRARRFKESEVKALLRDAIDAGRIAVDELKPDLSRKLK